jgi:ribosome-associated toxin RatA of RatAB toxin-antitoxin module
LFTVKVEGVSTSTTPDDAFRALVDFDRYGGQCELIESVRVGHGPDGVQTSEWRVRFREGIVRWVERDTVDRDERRLDFVLAEGDFATMTGAWEVDGTPGATVVRFHADIDIGMPTLAALLDPLAHDALEDSIVDIIEGLVDRDAQITRA